MPTWQEDSCQSSIEYPMAKKLDLLSRRVGHILGKPRTAFCSCGSIDLMLNGFFLFEFLLRII
jgi:hypothetical protein